MTSIEEFLGLTEEEIQLRIGELERKIPTNPGIGYLQQRLKEFEVQPWPFLSYMVYHFPEVATDMLNKYTNYDGAENGQLIMEKLRGQYILVKVLAKKVQFKP